MKINVAMMLPSRRLANSKLKYFVSNAFAGIGSEPDIKSTRGISTQTTIRDATKTRNSSDKTNIGRANQSAIEFAKYLILGFTPCYFPSMSDSTKRF